MNISVLIVTYGDRGGILNTSLNAIWRACPSELISEVIVVDNASSNLEIINRNEIFDKIIFLKNSINLGSAGGIKQGLEYIDRNFRDRFVLILDDDNVVENGFFNVVVSQFENLAFYFNLEKSEVWKICIKANRVTRDGYAAKKNRNSEIDSFCDFRMFSRKLNLLEEGLKLATSAPWGGLFIHQEVIRRIGLPISEYFVYGDDFEYTSRMSRLGVKIICSDEAVINDICASSNRESAIHRYFQRELDANLLYYQIRNHSHASRLNAINYVRFNLNLVGFVALNLFRWAKSPVKNFARLFIIIKALVAGLRFSRHID